MKHTISHNGFHGLTTVVVHVEPDTAEKIDGRLWFPVSDATAKRINRACCPSKDCTCGEHIAVQFSENGNWFVPVTNVWGNYPQR